MKLSAKNKQKLYKAIYDEVMLLKISLATRNEDFSYHPDKNIDNEICFLDDNIYRRIKKYLEIED